jgi:hypothetical protein
MDVKWRFYEGGMTSLALKSGMVFPTGDEARGLGDGKSNYGLLFIWSFDFDPWALHAHAGYQRHRNAADERGGYIPPRSIEPRASQDLEGTAVTFTHFHPRCRRDENNSLLCLRQRKG